MFRDKLHTEGAVSTVMSDFLASLVVFLVALPLSLGIAVAAGVPPAMGLITGIVGGIVVGYLAGCPLQVSGPAAGLVAMIWEITARYGLENLGLIVLLAGVMQVLAGWFKLGQWFRAVPPSVIQGMLAGIGVMIFASQFHVMLDDTPAGSSIQNLVSIPVAILDGFFPIDGSPHHLAAGIGALTILLMVFWNKMPAKVKLVPAPLVAVASATLIAGFYQLPIQYIQVPDNLLNDMQWVIGADWSLLLDLPFWFVVFSVAFVASAETMLTAVSIAQMTTRGKTLYDREMIAQGVGNTLCGFLGSLPMTGVIVRSSVNVDAGGQTRLSAMLHGAWILLLVVVYPGVLNQVPMASLAAILVYTGYKLVNPVVARKLWKVGRSEFAIYLLTIIAILGTNLLEGVVIGFIASALRMLYKFSQLDISILRDPNERKVTIYLKGSATFMNLPKVALAFESLPPRQEIHVCVDELKFIDHACLEMIQNWEKQHRQTGGQLSLEWDSLMRCFQRPQQILHPRTPDPVLR